MEQNHSSRLVSTTDKNINTSHHFSFSAVNGFALGGGCELAMACHYRIMSTTAKIGLVEASLGLIPGFGGTQRLPRLMGFNEGTFAILSGKQFSAQNAQKNGIVDKVSDPNDLLQRAEIVALEFANKQRSIRRSLYLTDKIPDISIAKQQIAAMRKRFAKLFASNPATEYAVTAIMGIYKGPKQGLQVEIDTFDECIHSSSAKSQLHLFFAQRATTKIDIPIKGKMTKKISKIAVLGGGTMGSGIAALLLLKGYKVILKEVSDKYVDIAKQRVSKIVKRFEQKGMLRGKSAESVLQCIVFQTSYNGFNEVELVIEAVLEVLSLKQKIFKELVRECNDECILATNTSTINVDEIAQGLPLSARRRVIGLHFFSPPHIMQLLEIIRTDKVSDVILSDMVKLSKKIGKTAVVVGNCVGFAANRMFFPYCQAAHFLVEHGVDPYRIDRCLERFGMAMGVNRMIDSSGVDIFDHVEAGMKKAYNYCYDSTLLSELVKLNRLGQKTKRGMYIYGDKRQTYHDEDGVNEILNNIKKRKQFNFQFGKNELSDEDIVNICLFVVVNEAFKILAGNFAHKGSDLDIVSTQGYGFPKKRGGVHFWGVNEIGLKTIVSKLREWSNTFERREPNLNLGRFFAPCDALERASRG